MTEYTIDQVRAAIRESSDVFENHFNRADAAGLVRDYYVDHPIMSAPDASLLRGREAITGLFVEVMKAFKACRLVQVEVRVGNGLAYEVSRAILTPREAGPNVDSRYMIAWRLTPVGWRVETDFFAYGIV